MLLNLHVFQDLPLSYPLSNEVFSLQFCAGIHLHKFSIACHLLAPLSVLKMMAIELVQSRLDHRTKALPERPNLDLGWGQ
jgi:hypothetical protein